MSATSFVTSLSPQQIDELALTLVREYLAKKKYMRTLDQLHSELPFKPTPTTSTAVAKSLGLTKLHLRNAKSIQPFATLLETLAAHLIETKEKEESAKLKTDAELEQTEDATDIYASKKKNPLNSSVSISASGAPSSSLTRPPSIPGGHFNLNAYSPTKPNHTTSHSNSSSLPSHYNFSNSSNSNNNNHAPATTSSPYHPTSTSTSTSTSISATTEGLGRLSVSGSAIHPINAISRSPSRISSTSSASASTSSKAATSRAKHDDLVVDDDFDFEEEQTAHSMHTSNTSSSSSRHHSTSTVSAASASSLSLATSSSSSSASGTTITSDQFMALKQLIFGPNHLTYTFTDAWLTQGFCGKNVEVLRKTPTLAFALVQHHGGPCGVLAVIQAFMLREFLFGQQSASVASVGAAAGGDRSVLLTPSAEAYRRALIQALCDILWRVGDQACARVCLKGKSACAVPTTSRSSGGGGKLKGDGLTEFVSIFEFRSYAALSSFMAANIALFEAPKGPGTVLFLYSILFTRGLENVAKDRDDPTASMIGSHSYCSQELVNLMLTGRACSNVFDGVLQMDETTTLRGIMKRNPIGFLSLFEHYNYIKVGQHFKTPEVPIWVVCSESHYSVLFSLDRSLVSSPTTTHLSKFDLFYYDELANQSEEIRLTIDVSHKSAPPKSSNDLEPPLNECIRTKWGSHARVDWNGTEPIL